MESPAAQAGNAVEVDSTEIGKRELRSVRRRLVQSTLHPHKPQEQEENGGVQDEENTCGEDEELCGSQGRKKRRSKGKTTPQSRTSKKAKEKRAVNLTPKKILHTEEASPTIPDLRLEAKMIAEENSRMFAGRQIHPFFSSLKAGRKSQEATQSVGRGCTVERKESGIDCNPIHVYERTGDDELSPDWQNWTFLDRNIVNNGHTLQNTCSSVFEGSVKSLSLDDLPIVLQPSDSAPCANKEPMDHGSHVLIKEITSTVSTVVADKEMMLHHLLSSAEVDGNLNKTCGLSDSEARPILEHQSRFLQDRMQSYYLRCQSRPNNCLWTNKYQPKMAMEVCGNLESVKLLSEWLHLWYERNSQNKDFTGGYKFQKQDNNGNCSQSDSDHESLDGEESLKNVLLLTGSSGSGKSAAIYACAEEHGFRVFEFSASVIRSGAVLKQMIGEALQSHQLKWTVKNSQGSRHKFIEKSPSLDESTAAKYLANEVVELIPLSDDDSKDNSKGVGEFEYIVEESTSNQGEAKPLILLEDVDIVFLEDRGFISSIQEIADTGKGPIILTSNSSDPVLPDNLDRLQVSFIRPSSTELLSHLYMISASEGFNIQPCLLERIIHCCHKDIRKTIMHLQFWCQGKGFRDKIQKKYGSLLFDLDAGHQILPVIMPWSFPSELSELVDKEITKALLRMETTSCLLEASEGEFYEEEMQNGPHYQNYEASYPLEAKKVAMLRRNGSIHDHNEFSVKFDAAHECSNTSGTPIPLSGQKHRRRLDMVVSSDSEDEPINKECSLVPNKDDNMLSSHFPTSQNYSGPLNELLYLTPYNIDDNHYPCSETVGGIHVNEMSKSVNTSYVPESSYVPETVIDDTELFPKMASHGNAGASPEISVNEFFQNVLSVEANSYDSPHTVKETTAMLENTCNVFNFSRREGEGLSCNGHVENIIRGYPVMDECSRVDFNKSKFVEKPELKVSGDLVHELWKQLRLHHLDPLGHHVMLEKQGTFQIIELVHRMSHLISDSDLLLSSCQPQDILEMPTFVSEESNSFCWGGQQLQMASTIAQHGFCFFASDIATMGSCVGFDSRLDIVPEMLASATNAAALGKLIRRNMMENSSSTKKISELSLPGNNHMQERDMKSRLFNVIQHVAPDRSHLSLKGVQFFEYLSSLRCISRSETLRISKGIDKTKRRRGRVARHYLSTGSMLFSREDITLLGQSNLPFKDIHGC